MGLDMYLSAERWACEYRKEDAELLPKIRDLGIDWPGEGSGFEAYELRRTCAYWRKANQVHQWFVDNCQDGVDDCRESHVSIEQLTELRDTCLTLATNKDATEAKECLPTQSGFFFGGTEVDEWYWSDIDQTVAMLTAILEHPKRDEFSFTYRSSW